MEKAAYPADPVFASFPLIRKVFSKMLLKKKGILRIVKKVLGSDKAEKLFILFWQTLKWQYPVQYGLIVQH